MDYAYNSEVGGLYYNGETDVLFCINLNEIGFPQPLTPIKTDISADKFIVNAIVRQKGPSQCI